MSNKDTAFISRMPEELLREVVVYLERKDLKNLRQMDRKTRRVASEILFCSIEVHSDDPSQTQLRHITESSFWLSQVRTIAWYVPYDVHNMPSNFDCRFARHWQSQLVRKLPAVQTVHFRCSVLSQGWRWSGFWDSDAQKRSGGGSRYDLYRFIHITRLKPTIIKIGFTCIYLTYTPAGQVTGLSARNIASQLEGEENDVELSPDPKDKVRERHSHQMDHPCDRPFPNDLLLFDSIVKSHAETVEEVTLKGICVYIEFLEELVSSCPMLQHLSLLEVLVVDYDAQNDKIFTRLLGSLKTRETGEQNHKISANLTDIRIQGYEGSMSANDAEIARLMQGDEKTWLTEFQATYEPMSDDLLYESSDYYSSGGEDYIPYWM